MVKFPVDPVDPREAGAMTHLGASTQQRRLIAALAAVLFVAITLLGFLWDSNHEPLLLLNVVPVALIALEFGFLAGAAAGLVTFVAWLLHGAVIGTDAD